MAGNVLTVQRGYTARRPRRTATTPCAAAEHRPAPASPNDYKLYLNQAGAANQYTRDPVHAALRHDGLGQHDGHRIDNTAGLAVGQAVTGPGIPAGTTIAAIASATSITLSNAATLSQGNLPLTFGTVGGIALTLPGDIPNIQLEGGPGNNWIQVDPSVTRNVTIYGGPGYNVLMAGSGNDTLIAGPAAGCSTAAPARTRSTAATYRPRTCPRRPGRPRPHRDQ